MNGSIVDAIDLDQPTNGSTDEEALKTKWIEALRSGEYKQNMEGDLTKQGKYCCLGVLCHVAGMTQQQIKSVKNSSNDGRNEYLSDDLLKKFGLENKTQQYLAARNDAGASFLDIAKDISRRVSATD